MYCKEEGDRLARKGCVVRKRVAELSVRMWHNEEDDRVVSRGCVLRKRMTDLSVKNTL